jgi:hypothetical protein
MTRAGSASGVYRHGRSFRRWDESTRHSLTTSRRRLDVGIIDRSSSHRIAGGRTVWGFSFTPTPVVCPCFETRDCRAGSSRHRSGIFNEEIGGANGSPTGLPVRGQLLVVAFDAANSLARPLSCFLLLVRFRASRLLFRSLVGFLSRSGRLPSLGERTLFPRTTTRTSLWTATAKFIITTSRGLIAPRQVAPARADHIRIPRAFLGTGSISTTGFRTFELHAQIPSCLPSTRISSIRLWPLLFPFCSVPVHYSGVTIRSAPLLPLPYRSSSGRSRHLWSAGQLPPWRDQPRPPASQPSQGPLAHYAGQASLRYPPTLVGPG